MRVFSESSTIAIRNLEVANVKDTNEAFMRDDYYGYEHGGITNACHCECIISLM